MKKSLACILAVLMVFSMAGIAFADEFALPNWNIEGEWEGWSWQESNTFTLTIDEQDAYGNFTGTSVYGTSSAGGPVVGKVSGDKVEFTLDSGSYTSLMIGDITATKMEGTFQDTSGTTTKDETAVWDWEATGEARWIDYYEAAPAVAARLLKDAGQSPRYGSGRTGGNHIADVAHYMGDTTDFDGVSKSNTFEYEYAVADFLNNKDNPAEVAYPENTVTSVVFNDKDETGGFGTFVGDEVVITFKANIIKVDDITATFSNVEYPIISNGTLTDYNIDNNVLTFTANGVFTNPRYIEGEFLETITGLEDSVGNPVVILDGGVMVQ